MLVKVSDKPNIVCVRFDKETPTLNLFSKQMVRLLWSNFVYSKKKSYLLRMLNEIDEQRLASCTDGFGIKISQSLSKTRPNNFFLVESKRKSQQKISECDISSEY